MQDYLDELLESSFEEFEDDVEWADDYCDL